MRGSAQGKHMLSVERKVCAVDRKVDKMSDAFIALQKQLAELTCEIREGGRDCRDRASSKEVEMCKETDRRHGTGGSSGGYDNLREPEIEPKDSDDATIAAAPTRPALEATLRLG